MDEKQRAIAKADALMVEHRAKQAQRAEKTAGRRAEQRIRSKRARIVVIPVGAWFLFELSAILVRWLQQFPIHVILGAALAYLVISGFLAAYVFFAYRLSFSGLAETSEEKLGFVGLGWTQASHNCSCWAHRLIAMAYGLPAISGAFLGVVGIATKGDANVPAVILFFTLSLISAGFIIVHYRVSKGALKQQKWARKASIALGLLLLLGIPIGTIAGIYLLLHRDWGDS